MDQIVPTIKPTLKQHLAYTLLRDQETSFVAFGGGAEGGKSWLGAEWLLTNCYFYPGTKWFIGRNELTRLMASSYATFRKVSEYHQIPPQDWKLNGKYNYIEFRNALTGEFDGNGSRIDLIDLKMQPSDPMFQRFGSTEYTGGWIEEGGEVNFIAFDVLKSRVGRWKNDEYGLMAKILITCNPEKNWLYRIFYKPWTKQLLPKGYAFIQSLYSDNPYTRVQAEKRLDMITDRVLRARLKLGLWEYEDGDNSLVTYDAIMDMFTNSLPPEKVVNKFLTADVARYGSDKITFGFWKGLDVYQIVWKTHRGIDQTVNDMKEYLKTEAIPYSHALADDDGVGGGVVDMARGIKGFIGNSSPITKEGQEKKENYGNLRSQCGYMLADYIMNHRISITAPIDEATKEMIIEDLQQLKKKETPIETPLRLISKEEIKDAIGRSPDFGDMLMMRMYFELVKPTAPAKPQTNFGGVQPYYPELGI